MSSLEGIRVRPPTNTPQIRKHIPRPYSRPAINVGGANPYAVDDVARDWQHVPAYRISAGDIVPGLGLIQSVEERSASPAAGSGLSAAEIVDQSSWTVVITGLGGQRLVSGDVVLFAFTAKATRE